MTREEADFIGGMNMCDEISNEAYKKIMCHCEEQEPCEDSISRKAVLSKFKEVCFSEEWLQFRADNGSNGQRDFLINYIEQLPSVTPQPDTARRIVGKSRGDMTLWYQCEICNEPVDAQDTFCNGCGRRLVDGCEKQAEDGR